MLTKRQYTEMQKRQDKILYLLSNKFNIHKVGISLKDRVIYFSKDNYSKEYRFGIFFDYKTLKKLQDNIITHLQKIDHATNDLNITKILNKDI